MNLDSVKALATSKIARQALQVQKHSPKVLFIAGAVGAIGATVLACRATLKLEDVLDKAEANAERINRLRNDTPLADLDSGEDENLNKLAMQSKLKTSLEIAKLYAPAAGLMLISVAALTGSHVILSKRNGAVMAAYAGLDRAYKEYRQRVSDAYGKDVDAKFATGTDDLSVEEKTTDGKTKTTIQQAMTGKFGGSPYAVVFDERSQHFTKEPGMNANIVQMKQNWANDKLRAKGHLFLNEVYDMLDLPRTKAGAMVGWVYRKDNESQNGDNYVSFGVFDGDTEWVEAFIDGAEKYVVLDFNVDGMILDLI